MYFFEPDIFEKHRRQFESAAEGAVVVHGSAQALESLKVSGEQLFDGHSTVDAGCLAKVITSAVLLRCVEDRVLSLDATLLEYLGSGAAMEQSMLADIKIVDLLNHMHGLDLAVEVSDVLSSEGRIERERLLASVRKVATPGRIFLYGFAGPVLAACVLEAVTGKSYRELVTDFLARIGLISEFHVDTSRIFCPAINLALKISPLGLAKMLQWMLAPRPGPGGAEDVFMRRFTCAETRLPENHFGGDKYSLGWYRVADRLSVNAHGFQCSASIMVDLSLGTFLIVAARSPRLFISYMVFSSCLERLGYAERAYWESSPEVPAEFDPAIEGDYENGRFRCSIRRRRERIGITVTSRNTAEVLLQRVVRHQYGNVFQVFPGGGDFMTQLRYEKCEDGEFLIANHHHFKKVQHESR